MPNLERRACAELRQPLALAADPPIPRRIARSCLALSTLLLLQVSLAHAEVAVGSFANPGAIRHYADGAVGDTPPARAIGGVTTGLLTPAALTFDPLAVEMFVSDFYGQTIRVFDPRQTGDRSPLRTLSLSTQPRHVIVDRAHDELAFVSYLGIYTYARSASGSAPSLRWIEWGGLAGSVTRLDDPSGLVLLASTDQLLVGDYQQVAGGPASGEVLVYPRTANGNVAPVREIRGPQTQLACCVRDLALDAARNELYVLAVVQDVAGNLYRVLVFDALASGDAAPLRLIEGAATSIEFAGGIGFDATSDRVWVTTGLNGGTPRLLAFPRLANGNVAPNVVIEGGTTGLTEPYDVLPYGIPALIFSDGFE